jgi:endonuclease YncB( thermonuclease family)
VVAAKALQYKIGEKMKKIITMIAALSCSVAIANPYDWKITRVIDGDTVEFAAPFLPDPLPKKLSIRVLGVDTPEKGHRASCPQEAQAAEKASQFTKDTLNNAYKNKLPVLIELQKHDKYGGRVLGDVIVNGERLSAMLIANGHARPYHGEKKSSWCN